jgi:RNA polymerase sigma factor (sigma-70 family)
LDELWSEHERRRVLRLCAVISGEPAAAEDLAQQVMLEAWRIRNRLVDGGYRPWLDAIARNVCLRWRSSQGRRAAHEVVSDSPGEEAGAPDDGHDPIVDLLEKEELAELVERALGLLPVDTRAALVARYIDGLGAGEIAHRLETSPDAVSMRLARGRARLRALLETDLGDDPLAQVWITRYGVAWRPTRIICAGCGRSSLSMRRDSAGGTLELRCDGCDPTGIASRWRLDNPELRPHLEAVQRPTAVVARMAAWSHSWWPVALATGRARCTRCGAEVAVRPYLRSDALDIHTRAGWYIACAACGEALSTSLLGLTLVRPEVRALRARRPRAHAVPARWVDTEGQRHVVVGLRDDASGEGIDVHFDAATYLPVIALTR